ncbi:MAG: hypothetical protein JSW55_05560 [Chloroflexota bacterium]|nr:MAG: hypothetical protein JSW55_05560 [Chloroflexota bacterium]
MLTVRRLFAVLLFLAIFVMAVRETLDPDMWWHLRTGQVILEQGIPRQDIYSFTVPDHRWITHEWLSEVVMWLGYQAAGLYGLILVSAALVSLAFALVYKRCLGRPYLAGFVILLAALASAPFWGVRPQLFNMLFTAAFVFLVEGYKDGKIGRRGLWALPLLTLLWANMHSGYLVGIALLLAYLAGESITLIMGWRRERGLTWLALRWLGVMTLASFLIAVLNPNGPALWIYPFFTLGSNAMQSYIQEWASPDFHQVIFWPFAALLGVGLLAMVVARRAPSLTDGLLFGGTAAAGLLSARHIPIFAIVASPIICRQLLLALEETRFYALLSGQATQEHASRLALLNGLLLLVALVVAASWSLVKLGGNEAAIAGRYPEAAVDYLVENGLDDQRGYNSYNWGGYLIWRGLPVYVDGRADVYGDEFLHYYRRTFDLTERWRQPLDDYEVDYVLVEHHSPLSNLLTASDRWQLAFDDNLASIFTRSDG